MSVDVEDWFPVGAFEDVIDKGGQVSLARRVEANRDLMLAMGEAVGITARRLNSPAMGKACAGFPHGLQAVHT